MLYSSVISQNCNLGSFSKILEKVVSIRLTNFLEKENILTKFQFRFRKSHSTAHAMVHFLNNVSKALNEKKHTIANLLFLPVM
jgi:hypothetical protein